MDANLRRNRITNSPLLEEKPKSQQPDFLEKKYLGKQVQTERGKGVIVGFDLPLSRAWRFKVKITNENTDRKVLKSMFPDNVLCFDLREVTFI